MTIDTRDRGCQNPGCWATWVDGAETHECAFEPVAELDPEVAWQRLRDAGYSELELRRAAGDR